ncbi:acyloxyacyl hydrolase [Ascidiimonas sp. W6]|uniref:acyloxyacyl hydrolase n=1 Tax=Ascidiimonas meishanensis TaxID=3128903 RepID=UPI0030ED5D65
MGKNIFRLFFFLCTLCVFSQENKTSGVLDVNYFYGNVARHNDDILHLITGHPEGLILSYSKKTFGYEEWEQQYNYPDYGLSFTYQNLKNEFLGENYGLYAHYNFYFLKRKLMFRIAQGLAVTTNPYNRETNFRNVAFGTRLLSSTYVMLNYRKENILDRFGLQGGFSLIHYSNANVEAPNTSVNSITFNLGVTYNLEDNLPEYIYNLEKKDYRTPWNYNMLVRTGINESDVIDSGQFGFLVFTAYADKRLNRKSGIHAGAELFLSNFLKEYITYRGVAFPGDFGINGDEDYKRVGVFVGHELYINRFSVLTQLGYYVYYPVEFEGRVYIRAGLKRYFGKRFFGELTLKSHGAKAETVEFGLGIRL